MSKSKKVLQWVVALLLMTVALLGVAAMTVNYHVIQKEKAQIVAALDARDDVFSADEIKTLKQFDADCILVMDAGRIALIFVQLFGEELFKINMLLGILLLLFRRSGNRKSAIVIATLVTALVFGLAHYAAYGSIVQILLVQGLGCIIDVFAYLKTKNILTSYAAHLLLDFIPLGLAALGAL